VCKYQSHVHAHPKEEGTRTAVWRSFFRAKLSIFSITPFDRGLTPSLGLSSSCVHVRRGFISTYRYRYRHIQIDTDTEERRREREHTTAGLEVCTSSSCEW
jgi:hypothetical protein